MNQKPKKVTITTDGGCDPNPGVGAWAAILRYGSKCMTISGVDPKTTNNRMELTAIAEGLEALKVPCVVKLRTDSQIAINAICAGYLNPGEKRRLRWERKGANMDLVHRIWAQLARHTVRPVWVKGHSGDHDNEACDRLCGDKIKWAKTRRLAPEPTDAKTPTMPA